MNKLNITLITLFIVCLIGAFIFGIYLIWPKNTNTLSSPTNSSANQVSPNNVSLVNDTKDQDTLFNIVLDLQKVPLDGNPSDYFVPLNDLLKGF